MLPAFMSCSTQHHQVLVLDRRRAAARRRATSGCALDLQRAREREQRVQLRPFRRDPLLVAVQPDLGVEAEMHDLAARGARAAAACHLSLCAWSRDLARERVVGEQERLREVEQRRPELVLDLRAAARVLDVLRGQRLAQRAARARRRRTPPRAAAACVARCARRRLPSSASDARVHRRADRCREATRASARPT